MTNLMDQESCSSLVELQDRHEALVESADVDTEFVPPESIKRFMQLCVAMGHILEAPADRSAAQSLITYWSNRLARQTRLAPAVGDDGSSEPTAADELDDRVDNVEHSEQVDQADQANRADQELTQTNIEDTVTCAPVGRWKTAQPNNRLLGEFQQEAFDKLVIEPTQKWLDGLSDSDWTLVGQTVLRLMTLNKDGKFEIVPSSQLSLEGLPDVERAKEFLEKLVRLGVVRRQRRSIDLEEYTLPSLERLGKWDSLNKWMRIRKAFRDSAKSRLAWQLAITERSTNKPLLSMFRSVRRQMTKIGSRVEHFFSERMGNRLVEERSPSISDEAMQEAEYYHDKSAEELKVIYLQRQLERVQAETNQERLVGVSCALGVMIVLTAVALNLWRVADKQTRFALEQKAQAEKASNQTAEALKAETYARKKTSEALDLAELTTRTSALFMAERDDVRAMRAMAEDPTAAWLKGINSFNVIVDNQSALKDPQAAARWKESCLWSMGSASLQSPILLDLLARVPAESDANTDQGKTALSENGEVCVFVDWKPTQLDVRFHTKQTDGTWQRHEPIKLQLGKGESFTKGSLAAYLNTLGSHLAITVGVTSQNVSQTRLYAGAPLRAARGKSNDSQSQPSLQLVERFDTVRAACFDTQGKYLAVAYKVTDEAASANDRTETSVWSTADWTKPLAKGVPTIGRITNLAFSREFTANTVRGSTRAANIRLSSVVVDETNSYLAVQQIALQGRAEDETKGTNVGSNYLWTPLFTQPDFNPDSTTQLLYSSAAPDLLFFSHDGRNWLVKPDSERPQGIRVGADQTESNRNFYCTACAFSPDASLLALGLRSGQLSLWNVAELVSAKARENSKPESAALVPMQAHPQHREEVFGVRFSPDNNYLISCSRDKQVQIYNVALRQMAAPPMNHHSTINAANISADGRFLSTLTKDTVFAWEFPAVRSQLESWAIPTGRSISAIAHSENDFVAVGGTRGEKSVRRGWIRACQLQKNFERPMGEIELNYPVQHLSINQDGQWICGIDERGAANLFHLSKVVELPQLQGFTAKFSAFDAHSAKPRLLVCGENVSDRRSVLKLFELDAAAGNNAFQLIGSYDFPNEEGNELVSIARFDPWQTGCVVGTDKGHVYYCAKGQPTQTLSVGADAPHGEKISEIAFHAATKLILSGSEDDRVAYWHVSPAGWESKGKLLDVANNANITSIAVSASGRKLATASANGRAVIWEGDAIAGFKLLRTVESVGAGQSGAPALAQVNFVPSADERYLFCRSNDRTVRVFDTLQIPSPIQSDSYLVDGREVTWFSIPHNMQTASLKVDEKGQWVITAVGYENRHNSAARSDLADDAQLEPLRWDSNVRFSQRVVSRFPESWLTQENRQSTESLVNLSSGRRINGLLRPLTPLTANKLFGLWQSANHRFAQDVQPPMDSEVAWHLREAENALSGDSTGPTASLWHWSRSSESLPPYAHLQYATALARAEAWSKAAEELAKVATQLEGNSDFLSIRAAVHLNQYRAAKDIAQANQAVADYQKILELNPGDVGTHLRLLRTLSQSMQNSETLKESDRIIKNFGEAVPAEVFKLRAIARNREKDDPQLTLVDMIRAGELYFKERNYEDAKTEIDGAIAFIKQKQLESTQRHELAELNVLCGDVMPFLAPKSTNGNNKLNASEYYFRACQIEPDSLKYLHKFFDSLPLREYPEGGEYDWSVVDKLFLRAIELDSKDPTFYRQRVSALLPKDNNAKAREQRLQLAIDTFTTLESTSGLSLEFSDYLDLAALHVNLTQLDEAEKVLRRAKSKFADLTIIDVRLGLVLALQNKEDELKQLVKDMLSVLQMLRDDMNNTAWTACFTEGLLEDFSEVVRLSEAAAAEQETNAIYLNTLGLVYLRAGKYQPALDKLKSASERRNNLSDNLASQQDKLYGSIMDKVFASMAYLGQQEFSEATETFEQAEVQFKQYKDTAVGEGFCDSVWNTGEYELFSSQVKRLLEM